MSYLKTWFKKWAELRQKRPEVLTMNQRNLMYIYPSNPRASFPLADNKLLTKELLTKKDIPMPDTYYIYDSFYGLRNLEAELAQLSDFVIKPAQGSGGGGILVIVDRDDTHWITAGGHRYTLDDLKEHLSDIIFGIHSLGLNDQAMIEARIIQHEAMNKIYCDGLADLRIIVYQHNPVMAMLRIPTDESDGKANLHQGAIGAGVDIETGKINHAIHENESITHHINTQFSMSGFEVPHWNEAIAIATTVSQVVPLKYIGVDIALSESGPVLLEINVRPGIAIQNANNEGLRLALSRSAEHH